MVIKPMRNNHYLFASFLLSTSMLYLSYLVPKVEYIKYFDILIYLVLLYIYIKMPKTPIRNSNSMILYVLLILFGFFYLIRALWDFGAAGEIQHLYSNNITVLFYIINGMIIPMFFLPRAKFEGSFKWAYFITGLVLLFALLYSINKFIQNDIREAYRDQLFGFNDSLGVIEYGHLGLTAAILGAILFIKRKEHYIYLIVSVPLMAVGISSIFLSGTRSAMVGLFIVYAVYALARLKLKSVIPFLFFFFLLVYYSDDIISFSDSFGVSSQVSRVFRLINESGDQSSGRIAIWKTAISHIRESPILGVSCFFHSSDPTVKYVHNSLIEVFYALGFGGFIVFLVFNIVAIIECIRIFRSNNTDAICFACLYLQYFSLSLFSNSIIRLPLYWYFLAMVLCIHFNGQVTRPIIRTIE